MSAAPLLSGNIEADDEMPGSAIPKGNIGSTSKPQSQREPVLLLPGKTPNGPARTGNPEEAGLVREGGGVTLMLLLRRGY